MKVAFGVKAHSGWAALVVVGRGDAEFVVVDRRRVDLIEEEWAKQPYHAAQGLRPEAAREVVKRGVEAAHRISTREVREAIKRERDRKNEVSTCAVLTGNPMPDWSVEDILAVHFRMHKAEGVLFRDALALAAKACGLRLVAIPERTLLEHAQSVLGSSTGELAKKLTALGSAVGAPWGRDQKDAALAAMIALQRAGK